MPRSAMVYGHGAAGSSSATKAAVVAAPRTKHSKFLTDFMANTKYGTSESPECTVYARPVPVYKFHRCKIPVRIK